MIVHAAELDQRLAEAAPEQPAVRLCEQGLGDLVALVVDHSRLERVDPDVDSLLHVAHVRARKKAPAKNIVAPTPMSDRRPVAT